MVSKDKVGMREVGIAIKETKNEERRTIASPTQNAAFLVSFGCQMPKWKWV